MEVAEIMNMDVITVEPGDTVGEAIDRLKEHHISGMPVVDAADRVIGVLSESDLIGVANDALVRDVMTEGPITIEERTPVEKVAVLMRRNDVNRIPVVAGGQLVGIVSRDDLIEYIAKVLAWDDIYE